MSGAQTEVPLLSAPLPAVAKAMAANTRRRLNSFRHMPGLYVVYPATPADAKGMLKSAIRENNPILFVESNRFTP